MAKPSSLADEDVFDLFSDRAVTSNDPHLRFVSRIENYVHYFAFKHLFTFTVSLLVLFCNSNSTSIWLKHLDLAEGTSFKSALEKWRSMTILGMNKYNKKA